MAGHIGKIPSVYFTEDQERAINKVSFDKSFFSSSTFQHSVAFHPGLRLSEVCLIGNRVFVNWYINGNVDISVTSVFHFR